MGVVAVDVHIPQCVTADSRSQWIYLSLSLSSWLWDTLRSLSCLIAVGCCSSFFTAAASFEITNGNTGPLPFPLLPLPSPQALKVCPTDKPKERAVFHQNIAAAYERFAQGEKDKDKRLEYLQYVVDNTCEGELLWPSVLPHLFHLPRPLHLPHPSPLQHCPWTPSTPSRTPDEPELTQCWGETWTPFLVGVATPWSHDSHMTLSHGYYVLCISARSLNHMTCLLCHLTVT